MVTYTTEIVVYGGNASEPNWDTNAPELTRVRVTQGLSRDQAVEAIVTECRRLTTRLNRSGIVLSKGSRLEGREFEFDKNTPFHAGSVGRLAVEKLLADVAVQWVSGQLEPREPDLTIVGYDWDIAEEIREGSIGFKVLTLESYREFRRIEDKLGALIGVAENDWSADLGPHKNLKNGYYLLLGKSGIKLAKKRGAAVECKLELVDTVSGKRTRPRHTTMH